jgi:hypothetical protein
MSRKQNVKHLIGRQLVPFFVPGTEEENCEHKVDPEQHDAHQFGGGGGNVTVEARQFVDGYFQEAEAVTASFKSPPSSTSHYKGQQPQYSSRSSSNSSNRSSSSKQQQQPQRSKKNQTSQTTNSTKNQMKSNNHYAGAAFDLSPSPMDIPMPKFVNSSSSSSSRTTPQSSRATRPVTRRLLSPEQLGGKAATNNNTAATVSNTSDATRPRLFLLRRDATGKTAVQTVLLDDVKSVAPQKQQQRGQPQALTASVASLFSGFK